MSDTQKIRVTADGCVDERDMIRLPKTKATIMKVEGAYEYFDCKVVLAAVELRKGYPPEKMLVDVVTGTIYHPKTGQCNSSALRLIINQGQS